MNKIRLRGRLTEIYGAKIAEVPAAEIEFEPLTEGELTELKEGDDILIRLRNIKLFATTDGLIIKGTGFYIHEPEIVAILNSS